MRRAPMLLAAMALLAGCGGADPDDVFYWLGRVADAGGAARPGATASLSSSPLSQTRICSPTGRPELVPGTSSGALELHAVDYHLLRQATAGADGAFYFDVMRFEITPSYAPTKCFSLSAEGPGGTTARSTTAAFAKDYEFPDLAQWSASWVVEPGSPPRVPLPALPWPPSRDGAEVEPLHTRRTYYDWTIVGPQGELAWQQLTELDPLALDPELLEDFPGLSVTLQAWLYDLVETRGLLGSNDVSEYATAITPSARSLAAGGMVPASRGAACTVNGAPFPGCPLTDGSLELKPLPSWLFTPPPMPDPSTALDQIVLTLPGPIVPRLLVLRDLVSSSYGAGLQFTVEGSDDGVLWFPLVDGDVNYYPTAELPGAAQFYGGGVHLRLPLDSAGQAVRHVRISSIPFTGLPAAREISVFE